MADRKSHVILLAACLAGYAGGCHTVPPVPDHARANPAQSRARSDGQDESDGWLFKRLSGQDKEPQPSSSSSSSATRPSYEVRQASATETAPPGPKETVVTAATLAAASKPAAKKKEEEEASGFDLSALSPSTVIKNVKNWAGYGPDERIARTAYDEGHGLFREKKYDEAAKQFATAADRWPDTVLEEDALFWRAESLFFADRYPAADDAYDKLLKKYTYSRHLDKAVARQFAVGRYWEQFQAAAPHWPVTPNLIDKSRPLFDTWGRSIKAYEHVRLNDPTGPLADDALMATGNAYFVHGRYEDASINYDLLRKEYPKSEHQKSAHLLGVESKQRVYQGPLYDGTPLKEAAELTDQTLIRFGPTLGADRDRLVEAKNRMVAEQAERDWAVAQFYEKKGCYGSARYYYNNLVENYPQTRTAAMAKERLEQIKDYPAEPPDRLKWLTGLLGPVKKR
jgi:outer membrane protein assembly factor BamD (BamD/ComL family)